MKISYLTRCASVAGLAAVAIGSAHAQAVMPQFISAVGAQGNVTYTYNIVLNTDTRVNPGSITTFYDFNGLLTGGVNDPTFAGIGGASYAISTQLLGINPPLTVAVGGDDPTVPNVSLTYNGTSISNTSPLAVNLGVLTLHSTNLLNGVGDFTPFASSTFKVSSGTPAGNQGQVSGPNSDISNSAATPEPGTFALLLGMGITGGMVARRRLRRK